MRRLLWAFGWVAVAFWSLMCALAYGLFDIVGRLFMRNADSFSSTPETVEGIFKFFSVLHSFSTGGVLVVWAIVSLLILAVPWTIDRLAGREPPRGGLPQDRFAGPAPRDGVIDLGPDQYSVGPRSGDTMPPEATAAASPCRAPDEQALRLALYQPDIPQNAGTMMRMAACLGIAVDLIEPAGFDASDRNLRRAGLDYLDHLDIARHVSFARFDEARRTAGRRLVLATTRGAIGYCDFAFGPEDVVMVGRESAGVPEAVHEMADVRIIVPMQPGLRSLNVAVSAAMILGEALRQIRPAASR